MSVADVVQAVTERLGESVPSIVAHLAGKGVSHNSPGFRRLFCLVATAAGAQRALGRLFVQRRLEQQSTAPGNEAALHAALRGLGEEVSWLSKWRKRRVGVGGSIEWCTETFFVFVCLLISPVNTLFLFFRKKVSLNTEETVVLLS